MLENLLVDEQRQPVPEQHRVGFTLQSDKHEREVWVPFMRPSEITADRVMLA